MEGKENVKFLKIRIEIIEFSRYNDPHFFTLQEVTSHVDSVVQTRLPGNKERGEVHEINRGRSKRQTLDWHGSVQLSTAIYMHEAPAWTSGYSLHGNTALTRWWTAQH